MDGEVNKYRKRPVVIEAMRWDGSSPSAAAVAAWVNSADDGTDDPTATYLTRTGVDAFDFLVQTMEGGMTVSPGDFVIRGVKGEHYPCKPDIFALTYEPAALAAPSAGAEAWEPLLTADDTVAAINAGRYVEFTVSGCNYSAAKLTLGWVVPGLDRALPAGVREAFELGEGRRYRALYTAPQPDARSPSYGALEIIFQSVCGALVRAGVTDCDDPGEAIDVIRERYEIRIAALSSGQPDARDSAQVTLTMQQIKELAEFTGMAVDSSGFAADEMEGEYAICDCPAGGLLNDGEPGDPESFSHYARIVYCVECPEEGCIGLGPEVDAPNIDALAGPRP